MTPWIILFITLSLNVQLSFQTCGIGTSCANQGVCLNAACNCVQGYVGDLCEHPVDWIIQSAASNEVQEDAGSFGITILRMATGFVLDLSVQTSGTATSLADYISPNTVGFQTSEITATLTVQILDDDDSEDDETITFTIASSDGTSASVTYTIPANDIEVTVPPLLGVVEKHVSRDIQITRNVFGSELTVKVNSQDGTAIAGTDYTALTDHSVTFAAGAQTASFTVSVRDNEDDDGDKMFTLTVTGDTIKPVDPQDFHIADDEGGRKFDCRRHKQDCEKTTDNCTQHLPMCKCVGTPAREGEMCNIITEQKDGPACSANNVECNDGVCLDDDGATSCACYPGYYGDNCEHDCLIAVCSKDSMILIANPYGNFDGDIYVQGKAGVSACTAIEVNNPPQENDDIDDTLQGYSLLVRHDSADCGTIAPEEVEEDGTEYIRYSRLFFIQYQKTPNIATGLDQSVNVTCKLNKNNIVVNAGTVTVNPNTQFTEESRSDTFTPLTLVVETNAGVVTEASTISISTRLCITLRIPEAFGGLEIIYIEFNNSKASDPVKWRIYSSGCTAENSKTVLVDDPSYPESGNKRVMKFCFSAFTFLNSVKLAVEIKMKICLDPDDCELRPCVARRKRQADSSREEIVGATFNINTESDQTTGGDSSKTGASDNEVKKEIVCNLPLQFVPTVVSLGVVIFFLVILCLCLMYRLVRKTPLKVDKLPEPVHYKR